MKYRTVLADPPWHYERMGGNYAWRKGRPSGERLSLAYSTMSVEQIVALPVAGLAEPGCHLYLWTTQRYLEDAYGVARAWGFTPSYVLVWCKSPTGWTIGGSFMSTVEFVLFGRRGGVAGHLAVTSWLADAADRAGISRAEVDAHMGTSDMAGWWLSRLEHRSRVPTPEQFARLKAFLAAGDEMDDLYQSVREAGRWKGARIDRQWFTWPRGGHSRKPEAFLDLVEQVSPGPYVELFARPPHRLGWDVWGDESANTATLEVPA